MTSTTPSLQSICSHSADRAWVNGRRPLALMFGPDAEAMLREWVEKLDQMGCIKSDPTLPPMPEGQISTYLGLPVRRMMCDGVAVRTEAI